MEDQIDNDWDLPEEEFDVLIANYNSAKGGE